jgi:Holliday junction DNA helicase RuvA
MIAFLRGNIIYSDIEKSLVILDVQGVGYEIFLPVNQMYFSQFFVQQNHNGSLNNNSDYSNNSGFNQYASFFIYTYVREDRIVLYGFPNFTQRELFSILLDTKDIGPKLAVTILSNINADDFINLVLTKNIAGLSSIKGIGTLTAERIVSGLKNKIVKRFNSLKDVEAASIGEYNYNTGGGKNCNTCVSAGIANVNDYKKNGKNDNNTSGNNSHNNSNNNDGGDTNNTKNSNFYAADAANFNNGVISDNGSNTKSIDKNGVHDNNDNKKTNIGISSSNSKNNGNSIGKNIIYETALALNALGYSMADSIELASRTGMKMQEKSQISGTVAEEAYIFEINTENLIRECLKHIYKNKIS